LACLVAVGVANAVRDFVPDSRKGGAQGAAYISCSDDRDLHVAKFATD